MMEEIKIRHRCATVLGWKKDEWGLWHLTLPHIKWAIENCITLSNYESTGDEGMLFTTSEDWFKLLLDELQRLEDIANNNKEYGPMSKFISDFIGSREAPSLHFYLQTPLIERVKLTLKVLELVKLKEKEGSDAQPW